MDVKPLTKNILEITNGNKVVLTVAPWAPRGIDVEAELRELEGELTPMRYAGKDVILALRFPKPFDVMVAMLLKNVARKIGVFVVPEKRIYWFNQQGFAGVEEAEIEELKIELPLVK